MDMGGMDGMGGVSMTIGGSTGSSTTTTTTTTTHTSSHGGHVNHGGVIDHGDHVHVSQPIADVRCPYATSDADFSRAKRSVSNKNFSDAQMSTAKQVAKNNCLTSDQIFQLASIFSFESNKLEFAKYAYDFVYDPNNYYIVTDAFTFSSSTKELNDYIGH